MYWTLMWKLKSTQLIPGSFDQTSESQNSLKCESHLSKSCESTVLTNLNHICLTNLNLPLTKTIQAIFSIFYSKPGLPYNPGGSNLRGAQTLTEDVSSQSEDVESTIQFTLHQYLLNTNDFLKTAVWEISASCLGENQDDQMVEYQIYK